MQRPETGQILSHYRLVEKIGEGGMGEVWKAADTTLGRDVAIKILPEALATDPTRLARFEREAKLLASLNHPSIAAVHGLHSSTGAARTDDPSFLAMELVEGEDLSVRLKRGPLPVDEALKVCTQIAEALEAAHEQGVIHRDLKPANVVLLDGARAKVLDFGLAKALTDDPAQSTSSQHSPTVTSLKSEAGIILGTAAYMSPEQARGKPLDKRSDIWSFGCVLYECLTGRQLFTGETVTDVLSAILHRDPDWDALPDPTPPRVRDLLERCLERTRRDRLHDIADARIVLERSVATREWSSSGIAAAPVLPAARGRGRLRGLALIAAGLVLGAVAFFAGRSLSEPGAELPLRKFHLATQESGFPRPEISPDGTRVAYSDGDRLWVQDLAKNEPRELTGGEGVSMHAWSPGGHWLAISKESKLWKLPATGGEPVLLSALPESLSLSKAGGLTWSSDGRICYNVGDAGLMAVPQQGGTPVSMLEPGEGEQDFHHIQALPDGRGFLFAVHRDEAMDTLAVLTDEGRKDILRLPGQDVGMPTYSPSGHLLFWRRPDNTGIWAVGFSLDKLEVTGEPFPVTPNVGNLLSVSNDGTLVFVRPAPPRMTRLVLVDRDGLVIRTVGEPQLSQFLPALSPNGKRVAVTSGGFAADDVWIHEIDSGSQMRLTFDENREFSPAWMPDGSRVGFVRAGTLAGQVELLITAADGSGDTVRLARGDHMDFSPDGRYVAFSAPDEQLDDDIWYAPIDEDGRAGEPVELVETDGDFRMDFSPDGRLLVYAADETGRSEIYITRFPGGEGKWQVSTDGGRDPRWSPKGDRIYYRQGQDLMEVPVSGGASPSLGQPRKLFAWEAIGRGYDLMGDGERFVMIEETDPGAPGSQIGVVQNWAAEFDTER